jgi:hypothetical protein
LEIRNNFSVIRRGQRERAARIRARILSAVRVAGRSGLTRSNKIGGMAIVPNLLREGRNS